MTCELLFSFTGHRLRPRYDFPWLWHSACDMPDMRFRITKTEAGTVTTLRIDGELTGGITRGNSVDAILATPVVPETHSWSFRSERKETEHDPCQKPVSCVVARARVRRNGEPTMKIGKVNRFFCSCLRTQFRSNQEREIEGSHESTVDCCCSRCCPGTVSRRLYLGSR